MKTSLHSNLKMTPLPHTPNAKPNRKGMKELYTGKNKGLPQQCTELLLSCVYYSVQIMSSVSNYISSKHTKNKGG